MEHRADKVKKKEKKYLDSPDIVIKVVCKYRAELYFKISRKTKLSRLFNAWTERMDGNSSGKKEKRETQENDVREERASMMFLFTHMGRGVEPDETPEDAGMEDGDEILAVEMMDLTKDDAVRLMLSIIWLVKPSYIGGGTRASTGTFEEKLDR
jgi:hypothetical protein